MTAQAPPAVVAGAARQPLPYGLFSTFTFRDNSPDRWLPGGVVAESLTCEQLEVIGLWQCPVERQEATEGLPKSFDSSEGDGAEASPFTVYGSFKCSPAGWTPDQAEARARERLLIGEELKVEETFWTGAVDVSPSLVGDGTDLTAATAVPYLLGLGLLEDYVAAEYGSLGVIHMTRAAAISGLARGALVTSGGRLLTALGTPVAAGSGYPGTGPGEIGDPDDGETWMYVTPALFGYRGEVFTSSSRPGDLLNRGTNTLYAVAERSYVLGFDPCPVGAVLVTIECPCESTPK